VFIMGYEEPYLSERFGESYLRYRQRVGRWLPTLKPYE
jgi:protein-S-isoprenylcysteine O-methyltransferase Ste14